MATFLERTHVKTAMKLTCSSRFQAPLQHASRLLMTQYQDWERIAARIHGLSRAATALWEGSVDVYGSTTLWLIPSAQALIAELRRFHTLHHIHLSRGAIDSLTRAHDLFNQLANSNSGGGIPLARAMIAGLLALASELSFHIEDFDSHARPVVE